MDLDKLHDIVKKLDALLSNRETGLFTWWEALGYLLSQVSDLKTGYVKPE